MPVKTWQPPPGQQDRERQVSEPPEAELRSSDTRIRAAETNADAPVQDDLSAYGDEPINTHGSER